jgi:hypothetical protein
MNAMTDLQNLEAPLFKTWQGALAFAYNFTHGTVKKPFLAQFLPGGRRGRGLAGTDGATQSGMIQAEVNQLPGAQRRILEGRFAPRKVVCDCGRSCCAGFILGSQWAEAVEWLTEHILRQALAGTVSNFRLRRTIVVRYFGEEISLARMADYCGVKRDTAAEHNKRSVAYLGEQERAAEQGIQTRLYEAGLIES